MANPDITVLGGRESKSAQASSADEHSSVKRGLSFRRYFTKPGVHPFDTVEWELRTASISNEKGEVIFEQKDVEVPKTWSMTATNVVVSKYFHGTVGTPERESSIRQLVGRIAQTMTDWGKGGDTLLRRRMRRSSSMNSLT